MSSDILRANLTDGFCAHSMAHVGVALGAEIRRLRAAHLPRLRQRDLATAIGHKDPAQVNRIEQGRVAPDLTTLRKIAAALGVKPDHFATFGGAYDPTAPRRTKRQRAADGAIPQDDRDGHLQPAGLSPRVPLTPQDSVRESEAVLLRTLSLRSWSTVTRFAALVELHREHEQQLCQAVESVLQDVEEHGVPSTPKGRSRSGGSRR